MGFYIIFLASIRTIFGLEQDSTIVMQAIFNTDIEEAKGFSIQYGRYFIIQTFFVGGGLYLYSYFFINKKIKILEKNSKNIIYAIVVTVLCVVLYLQPSSRKASPFFYFYYGYTKMLKEENFMKDIVKILHNNFSGNSTLQSQIDKKTVILILGESDTRNNWSLYGYKRKTNPNLEKLQEQLGKKLVIFKNIISADSATVGSFQKMLTSATISEPDLWQKTPSIMLIAKELGYKVTWISNQGFKNRGFVSAMASVSNDIVFTNKGVERGESSFDEELIGPYKNALNDPANKKLIIVHMIGSHPAYNYRYPKEYAYFDNLVSDEVASELSDKGRDIWAIVFRNLYDNTILYHDFILSNLLSLAVEKKDETLSWLYLADHGQDVVHNSNFSGHNHKAKEQWEIPMLFYSEGMSLEKNKSLANVKYQTDVIDHTILGLMGIEGEYYNRQYDIFNQQVD